PHAQDDRFGSGSVAAGDSKDFTASRVTHRMFLALATNTHPSNENEPWRLLWSPPRCEARSETWTDPTCARRTMLACDGADIRRQVVWQVVFALGFTVVVTVLWVRFALGSINLDVPLDSLQLSRGRVIRTRLLSVGFLVSGLAPNAVSTAT